VPGLPLGAAVSVPERPLLGRVRDLWERDLLVVAGGVGAGLVVALLGTFRPAPSGG
jgi:hypothetical protein